MGVKFIIQKSEIIIQKSEMLSKYY